MQLERRVDPFHLDQPGLARAIEPLARGRRVEQFELLSGGHCNTNYSFRLERDPRAYVLRIYGLNPEACAREAALLRRVRPKVPVPEVMHSDPAGEALGGRPFIVTSWVDGIPLTDILVGHPAADVLQAAREAGAALAGLSAFRFDRVGSLKPDLTVEEEALPGFREFIGEALFRGHAGDRLGPELKESLWRFVSEEGPLLDALEEAPVLVHADFNPANILMKRASAGWRVAGILDWEFAHSNHAVFDFAALLRDDEARPVGFAEALKEGYLEAGGRLPGNWKELARLYDVLNMVEALDTSRSRPRAEERARGVILKVMERRRDG